MGITEFGIDKDYRIKHSPVNNKARFYRNAVGPQSLNLIAVKNYVDTDANTIYFNTSTGDDINTGTRLSPKKTHVASINACTSAKTKVIILNATTVAEDYSTVSNIYYLGTYADTAITAYYCLRTLGYTDTDANTLYVSKTGSDSNPGTKASPVLTITGTTGAISKLTALIVNVMIDSDGTFDENAFEMTGNFQGLYANIGLKPIIHVAHTSAAMDAAVDGASAVLHATAAYCSGACVLGNGHIVVPYRDEADDLYRFVITDKAGNIITGPTNLPNALYPTTGAYMFPQAIKMSDTRFAIVYWEIWFWWGPYSAMIVYDENPASFALTQIYGNYVNDFLDFTSDTALGLLSFSDESFAILRKRPDNQIYIRFYDYDGAYNASTGEIATGIYDYFSCAVRSDDTFVLSGLSASSGTTLRAKIYNQSGVVQKTISTVATVTAAAGSAVAVYSDDSFCISYYDGAGTKFKKYNSTGSTNTHSGTIDTDAIYFVSHSGGALVINGDLAIFSGYNNTTNYNSYYSIDINGIIVRTLRDFVAAGASITPVSVVNVDGNSELTFIVSTATPGLSIFNTTDTGAWNGIKVSVASIVNGITFDGESQHYLNAMFKCTAQLTRRYCEIKNVDYENTIFSQFAKSLYTTAAIDIQKDIIHDNASGDTMVNDSITYKNNLIYSNDVGYGIYAEGNGSVINISNNTLHLCKSGIGCFGFDGNEVVKNLIIHDMAEYDIYSDALITVLNSVLTGESFNVTATAGSIYNPMFIYDDISEPAYLDYHLQDTEMDDFEDSPALALGDDGKDAGCYNTFIFGAAESWTEIYIPKPKKQGMDRSFEYAEDNNKQLTDGDYSNTFSGISEVLSFTHDSMTTAVFLQILVMMAQHNPRILFCGNPYTAPATEVEFKAQYKKFKGFAKSYMNDDAAKQDMVIVMGRKYS